MLRYRSIGDILLANPSLAALRRRFPDATIDFLVDDVFAELLYKNRNVDHVLLNERKPAKKGLRAEWERLMEIRSGNYDLVVDLQAGPGARGLLSFPAQKRAWDTCSGSATGYATTCTPKRRSRTSIAGVCSSRR